MNKTSSAYELDFESFRESVKQKKKDDRRAARAERVSALRKAATPEWTKRKGSCVTIMVVVLVTVLPLVFMLGFRNVNSELNSKISELNLECERLTAESKMLKSDLDNKASLANAEEYAKDTLGLVRIQPSQIQHISISPESMTEIASRDDEDVLAAAGRRVSEFFGKVGKVLRSV